MNKSATECQPCDAFEPSSAYEYVHECYRVNPDGGNRPCAGTVYHCGNCGSDHHRGGWQTCTADKTVYALSCAHPLCIARRHPPIAEGK